MVRSPNNIDTHMRVHPHRRHLRRNITKLPCFGVGALADRNLDQSELVAELLKELSNHNERVEERKAALCELLKLIRDNTLQVWDEHFKTILLLLLETMGDREVNASFSKTNAWSWGRGSEASINCPLL